MLRNVIRVAVAALIVITGSASVLIAGDRGQAAATKAPAASPVDLNKASLADLEKLPGVGPATAARIIEYREKNGAFKKIEELMNVRGIGEKAFLKLKPLVTVSAAKTFA